MGGCDMELNDISAVSYLLCFVTNRYLPEEYSTINNTWTTASCKRYLVTFSNDQRQTIYQVPGKRTLRYFVRVLLYAVVSSRYECHWLYSFWLAVLWFCTSDSFHRARRGHSKQWSAGISNLAPVRGLLSARETHAKHDYKEQELKRVK